MKTLFFISIMMPLAVGVTLRCNAGPSGTASAPSAPLSREWLVSFLEERSETFKLDHDAKETWEKEIAAPALGLWDLLEQMESRFPSSVSIYKAQLLQLVAGGFRDATGLARNGVMFDRVSNVGEKRWIDIIVDQYRNHTDFGFSLIRARMGETSRGVLMGTGATPPQQNPNLTLKTLIEIISVTPKDGRQRSEIVNALRAIRDMASPGSPVFPTLKSRRFYFGVIDALDDLRSFASKDSAGEGTIPLKPLINEVLYALLDSEVFPLAREQDNFLPRSEGIQAGLGCAGLF